MAPVEGPHPVDTYVGTRIKVRRKLLKMTQTDLANALGVSYQQEIGRASCRERVSSPV